MSSLFDQQHQRIGTGAIKWDANLQKFGVDDEDAIPMWVSDYDFAIPPTVANALQQRVEHGVFGYTQIPSSYFAAIKEWYASQHELELNTDWISPISGVMPGVALIIELITEASDKIAVQSPGYGKFNFAVQMAGRQVEEVRLKHNAGKYDLDLEALEGSFRNGCKAFILCNPHNPVGRIWTEQEVRSIASLCHQYDVWLISDEIWIDLALPNQRCWSALNLEESFHSRLIVASAATKTFGLASLRIANMLIPNPQVRAAFEKMKATRFLDLFDAMAITSTQSAYSTGLNWLEELKAYIQGNFDYLDRFLKEHLPQLQMTTPQSGYLAWIDCRNLNLSDDELRNRFIEIGVLPSVGTEFGEGGSGYVRLNLGCPRDRVKQACERLTRLIGPS
ncbi:MalY/PatB family protein [Vibrio nigripulchritudo]|uniref:MalY/PatB family protein n=1 Tax=Vibrio nigripulchritudo TaxID=28173 RepID=UPI002490B845|nr:MalY/PatB family protein [Vibrio nigripulchritudo]BDU38257.1 cystathionine beta-lyase [Vibrio nigripulchritudo]BDU43979.1 cystathionine beta-lyase [Vibrio nigripulchritudo]